jgi:3-hydroxyanthranilate 3,4-dioxygenase
MQKPFNIKAWIEENRHLLKPPVGNQQVYIDNEDFIIMVVGGPNTRRDFHVNKGEEFFYQLEGDILLKVIQNDVIVDLPIKEGDIFLLPPNVPHSPRRSANTVGLVIERYRDENELDGFIWFCETCNTRLYEEFVAVKDIVKQLPVVMNNFYSDKSLCTCKKCGTIMQAPIKS